MKTCPMWGTFSCLPGGRGVEENQPNTTNVPIWGTLVVFGCGCSETRKRVPYGTHFHVWMGCGIRVGRGWGGATLSRCFQTPDRLVSEYFGGKGIGQKNSNASLWPWTPSLQNWNFLTTTNLWPRAEEHGQDSPRLYP